TLKEIEKYCVANRIQLDRKQIVELSMAIGGIPKYLSYIRPGISAAQIIQELCFTPGAPLTTEFQALYESLFDDYHLHMQIIELLARNKTGLTVSQISENLKREKGGSISRALKELIASNFVQFVPFYGKKTRDGRYRVVDEYSYFYLNWVQDAMYNYDESISQSFWIKQQSSSKYRSWAGYVFESVCLKHIRQIIKALDLTVVAEKASYWSYFPKNSREKGGQIDLVIDRADHCINLCEIKFWNSEYIMSDSNAQKLNERREIFRENVKTRKTLFNTLITPYGACGNKHYLSSIDKQLRLDALFLDDIEIS
ncbi:MAG: MarR family transcriptional regulator, partial [Chlamydiia bacterium]|nr:MarR family transcriptional regulator [Chlamydiia bacterium]